MPPAQLCELANSATVIASDAPRAIASAQSLAPRASIALSPLLRELELVPPHIPFRLPLLGWALVIGLTTKASSAERERARAAAEWLSSIEHETVIAVTHASVRRLIAHELRSLGWRSHGHRRMHHWSAWSFHRE
ncbi:MAG TPA: hypothetical protein VJ901_10820 [Thermoanaerobaculia bacterium]|nr:hypothetical protein [Thermoanaerobaculia bacterium]